MPPSTMKAGSTTPRRRSWSSERSSHSTMECRLSCAPSAPRRSVELTTEADLLPQQDQSAELVFAGICAFDLLPGAAGGMYPDTRHRMPSISLPSLYRIERHTITAPPACRAVTHRRTFASERPV